MPLASSSRVGTYYIQESSYGVTPTNPNIKTVRLTAGGDGLVRTEQNVQSEEIDASRLVTDQIPVGYSANFAINYEVSAGGAFDDFIIATLCGAVVTVTLTGTTLAFSSVDNSVNDSANGLLATGVVVKQWLRVSGTTGGLNDGAGQVDSVVAGKIVFGLFFKASGAATIVTQTAGPSVTLKGKMARTGIATQTSFSVEENFSDLTTTYQRGVGFRPVEFAMTAQARQKLTGTTRFLGNNVTTQTSSMKGSGSIVAADTAPVLNATSNVPIVYEGNTPLLTRLRQIGVTVNGNVTEAEAIANAAAAALIDGTFSCTGPFEAYFEDVTMLSKVLNHTLTSLVLPFKDGSTPPNYMIFTAPAMYLTGQLRKQGQNQPVLQNLTWTAVRDNLTASMFQVDLIHA